MRIPSPWESLQQFHQNRLDFASEKMEERYGQGNYDNPTVREMFGWMNEDLNRSFYSGDSLDVFND